jgi:hypothetical protein
VFFFFFFLLITDNTPTTYCPPLLNFLNEHHACMPESHQHQYQCQCQCSTDDWYPHHIHQPSIFKEKLQVFSLNRVSQSTYDSMDWLYFCHLSQDNLTSAMTTHTYCTIRFEWHVTRCDHKPCIASSLSSLFPPFLVASELLSASCI